MNPMSAPGELVTSRANALVKRLRQLKQRADPAGGLALIEGPRLLAEALAAGTRVVTVAASARLTRTPDGVELLARLARQGIEVRWLDEALLASLSEVESAQGALALIERPRFDEAHLFAAAAAPLLLVAVAVQNPGNLGALLRTAEAAGAHGAYLTQGCADILGWKALRGSMGSALRLPHVAGLALSDVLARMRARGVGIAAAALDTGSASRPSLPYTACDWRTPWALLVGNEGAGLPQEALDAADLHLAIPMAGAVESLNVGVAAGVLLFEAARQRRG
jgi:TrmH family RNA methyltransferase